MIFRRFGLIIVFLLCLCTIYLHCFFTQSGLSNLSKIKLELYKKQNELSIIQEKISNINRQIYLIMNQSDDDFIEEVVGNILHYHNPDYSIIVYN
ncbi:Aldo-keto reductase superfamily domain-containing protein [Candidatus Gromoviella agglomerans]|nr:Aldo-keto reductase superfamily domain-containing protein [Candidatus Gromoviella agglomerans]